MMAQMKLITDSKDPHFRSSTLQLDEQHLKENWERCLSDDNVTIPHRIVRIYNQRGDCTRVMHTNFLDTENDDNSLQIQDERENETAEDPMTDFLEMEADENTVEVTGLEEITMPEGEDLLVECSHDENDDEELQPLKTQFLCHQQLVKAPPDTIRTKM